MAVAAMLWTMLFCCAARGQSPDGATVQPNKLCDQVTTSKAAEAAETQAADAQVPSKGDDFDNRLIDGGTTQTEDTSSDTGDDRRWNLSVLDILWPLLAVLAGIVLLFWAARKYLPGVQRLTGSAAVEVLARTHLAPRQSINVVRLGRRILVVGQTAEQLSPLASISDAEEVSELIGLCRSAGAGSATSSFRKVFQRMDKEFAAAEDAGAETDDDELHRVRGELDSLADKVRRVTDHRK